MNGCCQRGRRGSGHRQARRAAVSRPGLLRTLEAAASSRVVTMQGQSGQPLTLAHIGTPGSSGRAPSPATPPLLGSGTPASAAGPPAASGASVAAPPSCPCAPAGQAAFTAGLREEAHTHGDSMHAEIPVRTGRPVGDPQRRTAAVEQASTAPGGEALQASASWPGPPDPSGPRASWPASPGLSCLPASSAHPSISPAFSRRTPAAWVALMSTPRHPSAALTLSDLSWSPCRSAMRLAPCQSSSSADAAARAARLRQPCASPQLPQPAAPAPAAAASLGAAAPAPPPHAA